MKKIISIIASLAITAALIPSAFAYETEALKLTADVTEFTDETFYEYYEESIPEGYDAYMVVLGIEGLADTLKYTKTGGTNAKPKLSGTALDKAEIFFSTDVTNDKFEQDYSYILDNSFSVTPTEGFRTDGNGWTMNYNGNFVYPGAKDIEITEIPEYFTVCFVVKEGTTATFTFEKGNLDLLSYTDGNISDSDSYSSYNGKLTMDPFTLGESGPVGPQPGDIKTPATEISGNKKYSEVYDSNLNARVVFEENIGAQTVTADSVLKAKYLNDTHVANIFELLGITGDGEVEFTSFTVKMVLPAGTAVTDDFSFVIQ